MASASFSVFRNRADGKYWGILHLGPNRFIYTRYSYRTPAMTIRRLFYNQNTNLMANATRAEILRWIRNAGVNRLSKTEVRNAIFSNRNLANHVGAIIGLHAVRRR
jgi:hypothetical protein